MTPKTIFEDEIAGRLSDPSNREKAKEIDAVYQFNVTGDEGGNWVIDLKDPKVEAGTRDDADCTITIGDQDFVSLYQGTVPPPQLFMMGKLQISGDIGLAMKLTQVLGS